MNEIREKIQRWQIKAESLLKENKRIFIKDINGTYFWADILIVGEDKILFQPFKKNNAGEQIQKYWADIIKFDEYKSEGDLE